MTLSVAVAVLMERALFRVFLKIMVLAPRRIQYRVAEERTHLKAIRRAGL
jgi:hypothetical protein